MSSSDSTTPIHPPDDSSHPDDVSADMNIALGILPWQCPFEFGADRRYLVEELIGTGRRSQIFRAKDRTLSGEGFGALVAIKIIHSRGTPETTEALSARRVTHENVVRILDRGVDPIGVPYLVMEHVDGGDLASRSGPWPAREAAEFMIKLARGVQASHSAGVVHCDLKPANVLLTRSGEPKLADFDLARSDDQPDGLSRGNFAYMSPEQFAEDENALAPPSDIYALGGILFTLLTGRVPHGSTIEEIRSFHSDQRPAPETGIKGDLNAICRRALARRRVNRYDSAAAFADDLTRWLEHRPIEWTHPSAIKRSLLWSRRNPMRAATLPAAIVMLISGLGAWRYIVLQDVRARQETVRATEARIEQFKKQGLATLRPVIQAVAGTGASPQLDEGLLAVFVWLDWIAGDPVLGSDGKVPTFRERVSILERIVRLGEKEGASSQSDVLLARFGIALIMLKDGDIEKARPHLEVLEKSGFTQLQEQDPIRVTLRAMRICADALDAAAAGKDLTENRKALDRAEAEIEANARCRPAKLLLAKVRTRLDAPPSTETPPH